MRTTLALLSSVLLIQVGSAAPTRDGRLALRTLSRRQVIYDPSCTGDQLTKAQNAFADLGTLSNAILNGPDATINGTDVEYRQSTAFTNYFEDGDYETVQAMHQALYNNRLPADPNHSESYTFTVKCGSDNDPDGCDDALAITYSAVGDSEMVLCDSFFDPDSPETVNDLDSKTQNDWCQTGQIFPFFYVAGEVLYHEMTHLDLIGAQAGLSLRPVDPDNQNNTEMSHGTYDVAQLGDDNDQSHYESPVNGRPFSVYKTARVLKTLWAAYEQDNTQYMPLCQRTENAESYAASALEWYFQVLCGFPQINIE